MEHDLDSGSRAFELILRTKLHRPQLSADLVNRDRLIEVMERADEVPLTVVSAPADRASTDPKDKRSSAVLTRAINDNT